MSVAATLRRAPMRLTTGAFILNSGLQKLGGDDETAKHIHGAASGAYPVFAKVEPKLFLRLLGSGETALGAALLLPIVRSRLAGAGLVAFSGALLGMWWRTPGMHAEGSLRPTQQGTAIAKDSWLLGIGAGLLVDDLVSDASQSRSVRRAERRGSRRAHKAARRAEADQLKAEAAERRHELKAAAKDRARHLRVEARRQARERAKRARKSARDAARTGRSVADSAGDTATSALHTVAGKLPR